MRLHAVVAVVRAELQKLGQVLVPHVQIDGHGTLAHAQLVYGHGRVVHQPHPSDDTTGHPFEATNAATRGPHLAEIHAHATPEFAHLREVVQTAVDTVQAVGHGVDEATRQLVVGLAGVGERRRRHGHLQAAQQVIDAPHPNQPAVLFLGHGQVERDTEKHLLHAFQGLARVGLDDISLQEQVETGIVQQLVALGAHQRRSLVDFIFRVVGQDIVAVETLRRHVFQLVVEAGNAQFFLQRAHLACRIIRKYARGNHLPGRRLGRRQFHGRLDERVESLLGGHVRLAETRELLMQRDHAVGPFSVFAGHFVQHFAQSAVADGGCHLVDGLALLVPLEAKEDVVLGLLVVAVGHEAFLHLVLDVLHRAQGRIVGDELLHLGHHFGHLLVGNCLARATETLADGYGNLPVVVSFRRAIAFYYLHRMSAISFPFYDTSLSLTLRQFSYNTQTISRLHENNSKGIGKVNKNKL